MDPHNFKVLPVMVHTKWPKIKAAGLGAFTSAATAAAAWGGGKGAAAVASVFNNMTATLPAELAETPFNFTAAQTHQSKEDTAHKPRSATLQLWVNSNVGRPN